MQLLEAERRQTRGDARGGLAQVTPIQAASNRLDIAPHEIARPKRVTIGVDPPDADLGVRAQQELPEPMTHPWWIPVGPQDRCQLRSSDLAGSTNDRYQGELHR
jgi:hypothetical protein